MKFSDVFQLPCPDSTDYAAVALYLQRLGLELDTQFLEDQQLYEGFLEPPTRITGPSANVTGISNGFEDFIFQMDDVMIFNNISGSLSQIIPTRSGW